MIRFRDTLHRNAPPPWLAKATGLQRRTDPHGVLWACGDAYLLGAEGAWAAIGDGYEVAGPADNHDDYLSVPPWVSTAPVEDITGRIWEVPRILDVAGERAFRVNYGADFLPSLTPQQYRLTEVAKAARDAVIAATNGTQDVGVQAACRWSAEFLTTTYCLPVDAIARLSILDDMLAVGVLSAAIGVQVGIDK